MLCALLEDVVGHSENLVAADDEASLFQRLALGAGEGGLAKLEMSSGELPVPWTVSGIEKGREVEQAKDSPTP
jgi:hypothetical protein